MSKESKSFLLNRTQLLRRVVQVISFLLLNLGIFVVLFDLDLTFVLNITKYLVLPIIQPYGSPFSFGSSAFIVIENALTSGLFPYFAIGLIVIIALIMGRWFCGWVCPFGLIHDIMGKMPTNKYHPSQETENSLGLFAYLLLIMAFGYSTWVGILLITGQTLPPLVPFNKGPYTAFDPYGVIMTVIPWMILNKTFPEMGEQIWDIFLGQPGFWIRLLTLTVVLLLEIYLPRAYCRWICPMGCFMGKQFTRGNCWIWR